MEGVACSCSEEGVGCQWFLFSEEMVVPISGEDGRSVSGIGGRKFYSGFMEGLGHFYHVKV